MNRTGNAVDDPQSRRPSMDKRVGGIPAGVAPPAAPAAAATATGSHRHTPNRPSAGSQREMAAVTAAAGSRSSSRDAADRTGSSKRQSKPPPARPGSSSNRAVDRELPTPPPTGSSESTAPDASGTSSSTTTPATSSSSHAGPSSAPSLSYEAYPPNSPTTPTVARPLLSSYPDALSAQLQQSQYQQQQQQHPQQQQQQLQLQQQQPPTIRAVPPSEPQPGSTFQAPTNPGAPPRSRSTPYIPSPLNPRSHPPSPDSNSPASTLNPSNSGSWRRASSSQPPPDLSSPTGSGSGSGHNGSANGNGLPPPSFSQRRPASMILYRLASDEEQPSMHSRDSTSTSQQPFYPPRPQSRFSTLSSTTPTTFSLYNDSKYPQFPLAPPAAYATGNGSSSSRPSSMHGGDGRASPSPFAGLGQRPDSMFSLSGRPESGFYPAFSPPGYGGGGAARGDGTHTPSPPPSTGAFLPYTYEYDPAQDIEPDDDDALHEPDPPGYHETVSCINSRGFFNVSIIALVILALLLLFIVYPIVDQFRVK